jgi:hypothetical protein
MTLYLNAIKLELEENIWFLDANIASLRHSVKYGNYLRTNDIKSLNADTIRSYSSAHSGYPTFILKTNALDMFKASGIMRMLDDKELLLEIWNVYATLFELKVAHDKYADMKLDGMMKEQLLSDAERQKIIPMYNFFAKNTLPYMMHRVFVQQLDYTKEVALKLEEALENRKNNN